MTVPETELRGTVQVMFATLVREGGLSGGVALSNQECSQGPKISVSIPAGTSLDKALGQVAASESASAWQLRDGVPNLLPAGPIPPLLVVRVPKVYVEQDGLSAGNPQPFASIIRSLGGNPKTWPERGTDRGRGGSNLRTGCLSA